MDVDTANAIPFKKLTPEECAQLAKEGRCFRCQLQGHMACNCPKNANNNNPSICTNDATTPAKESTLKPTTPVNTNQMFTYTAPSTTSKLMCAQQICTIEEAMADEEHAEYLDARDMGQDFWSARA
jgi:hypothetical protein